MVTASKPVIVKSWSWSRYQTYSQCPAKFRYQLLKTPTTVPKSPFLIRGDDIHKLAEGFLKGTIARLPKELAIAGDEIKRLKRLRAKHPGRVIVEETSARRDDWSVTTWDDWNYCWVRIKLDVAHLEEIDGKPVGIPTDWKTGKHRPDNLDEYTQQLDLYALDALMRWAPKIPTIEVRPRLIYLDTPVIVEPRVYTARDIDPLRKAWEKRVKPMFNDKKFAPKPNRFCGNCEYGISKNGPCKFG